MDVDGRFSKIGWHIFMRWQNESSLMAAVAFISSRVINHFNCMKQLKERISNVHEAIMI